MLIVKREGFDDLPIKDPNHVSKRFFHNLLVEYIEVNSF